MDMPIDLLTWTGASALALLLTQMLKYPLRDARLTPLLSVALGVLLLVGYAWLKGLQTPAELADVAVMGLFAGAAAVGIFEIQKVLPIRFPSVTPERA